jgi:PhnB protein
MSINAYLFFNGNCEEALNFYKAKLGANIEFLTRMSESPEPPPPDSPPMPGDAIMHASFRIGDTMLMASDSPSKGEPNFKGFSLSISKPTEAEARSVFNALSEGGKVDLPLGKTFWSPCFGMLTDKFGVSWMVGMDH